MATIKVKFRASSSKAKEGTLFYQIIQSRTPRQIGTAYKLYPDEWNAMKNEIVVSSARGEERRHYLTTLNEAVRADVERLMAIVSRFNRTRSCYTADDIVAAYLSPIDDYGLMAFGRRLAEQMSRIGKRRTAETYTTTLNSFNRFCKERDVLLDNVDSDLMMAYESYLLSTRICPNTTSYYMRNLRSIYNRAVERNLTVQRFPFRHVYTGIDKTVKRAVSIDVIRRIRDMDLSEHPALDYARDLFMFSFYTRGMSFVDLVFLRWTDLRNGVLTYRRRKTKQQLFIRWEKPMQDIVDKYNTAGSPYLLPVIKCDGTNEIRQYRNEGHRINRSLKKIGEMLGLPIPLTTYVARHGWASIAKSKNIPIATISEAMGHDSETTTRIYLASLDTSVVDKANRIILKSL